MSKQAKRVLIVDDQFLIVQYLRVYAEAFGFEVCGDAKTAEDAVRKAIKMRPEIILMDYRLQGDRDGVDAANDIYQEHPCRIIYVTGSSEESTLERIKSNHPFTVLIKPINPEDLGRALLAP